MILILSASTLSHTFDFGHGLNWLGFTEPEEFLLLMLRLLFLSLIVERVVELYVVIYRLPRRTTLQEKLSTSIGEDKVILLRELGEYKTDTAKNTGVVGFLLGVSMALVGIRIFTGMFDFEDASSLQIFLFDVFELFTMGALMAGGSKGINKIISAIETLASSNSHK